jgi:hypothetical protein
MADGWLDKFLLINNELKIHTLQLLKGVIASIDEAFI